MNPDLVLAEYNTLREELLMHMDRINQTYRLSMTAAVVILAWGITQKDWLILLTPIPILVVAIVMMLSETESMFRIAGYIRVFIEAEHPEMNWESRVGLGAKHSGTAEIFHNTAIALSYSALAAVSLYMAYVYAGNDNPITSDYAQGLVQVVAGFSIFVACIAAWLIRGNRGGPEKRHISIWEAVKREELAALTDGSAEAAGGLAVEESR